MIIGRNITCPYCFKVFKNTEAKHRCTNDETDYKSGERKCELELSEEYNDFWGEEVLIPHVFRSKNFKMLGGFNSIAKCDKCGENSNVFVCPNCCNHIPTEMVQYGSRIISVIGGPGSGKTTYIVSLINRLRKYGYLFGLQIIPQMVGKYGNKKEYTSYKIKELDDRLFKNHSYLLKTELRQDQHNKRSMPLIFRLGIDNDKSGKEPLYMVFYDTAGEAFMDADSIRKFGQYLESSEAILLLLDVLSIDKVRDKLIAIQKIVLKEDDKNKIMPLDDIMNTISNYIGQDNIKKKILEKPFAFAFSKFDYIIDNCDAFEFTDMGDTPVDYHERVNKDYLESINNYFKERSDDYSNDSDGGSNKNMLERWGCGNVIGLLNDFHKKMIFGISSTGGSPNKDGVFENGIKPYRVMDPLLWILDELHLINLK